MEEAHRKSAAPQAWHLYQTRLFSDEQSYSRPQRKANENSENEETLEEGRRHLSRAVERVVNVIALDAVVRD